MSTTQLSYSERYPTPAPVNAVYDDGSTIVEGDHLRMVRSGGLLPGYTLEGVAALYPGGTDGILYLSQVRYSTASRAATAYTSYSHINHGGSLVKIDQAAPDSSTL